MPRNCQRSKAAAAQLYNATVENREAAVRALHSLIRLTIWSKYCDSLRERRRVSLSAKRSHRHGMKGTLDFRTNHILTAFAKSVSPHSYKGRMKSDWVWIARPLRSRHFRP